MEARLRRRWPSPIQGHTAPTRRAAGSSRRPSIARPFTGIALTCSSGSMWSRTRIAGKTCRATAREPSRSSRLSRIARCVRRSSPASTSSRSCSSSVLARPTTATLLRASGSLWAVCGRPCASTRTARTMCRTSAPSSK
eukprot:Amastigsp_a174583_74.p2 type:complete len:139 gc:universal Amastigsp_a174583_74:164-580(+)